MKQPARSPDVTVEALDDRTLLTREGRVHHLPADVAAVWTCIDGQRTPEQLAAALGWTGADSAQRVWAALDLLADHRALTGRLAPPIAHLPTPGHTGLSRREALQRLAAGVAGGLALSLGARQVLAQDTNRVLEKDKKYAEAEVTAAEAELKEQTDQLAQDDACRRTSGACLSVDARKRVDERHAKSTTHLATARKKEAEAKRHGSIRAQSEESAKAR